MVMQVFLVFYRTNKRVTMRSAAHKATGGPLNFHGWMTNEYFGHPVSAFLWAIGGVLVAVIVAYIKTKNSN